MFCGHVLHSLNVNSVICGIVLCRASLTILSLRGSVGGYGTWGVEGKRLSSQNDR